MEEGGIGLELIILKGPGDPFHPFYFKLIEGASKLIFTW